MTTFAITYGFSSTCVFSSTHACILENFIKTFDTMIHQVSNTKFYCNIFTHLVYEKRC